MVKTKQSLLVISRSIYKVYKHFQAMGSEHISTGLGDIVDTVAKDCIDDEGLVDFKYDIRFLTVQ